jgi:hypothetical protein
MSSVSVRSTVGELETALEPWTPDIEAEREAVREQAGRILAGALFRNSRRFPTFLKHTVEHTLDGTTESLKERTLGVEAFGRDADYDTAQDPVVGMTAVEVRKRLAQYYQASEHKDEIRIGFQPGSYVAEFHRPRSSAVATPPPISQPPQEDAPADADASAGDADSRTCVMDRSSSSADSTTHGPCG